MATLPDGLTVLLRHAQLPPAALIAAADQPPLLPVLAARDDLPAAAIERGFRPGAPAAVHVAAQLADRPLPAATVHHILNTAGERRPQVLVCLVRHNVPDPAGRQQVIDVDDRDVDEAVLANSGWPVDDQLRMVHRTGGDAVLRWLSQLDVDVALGWDDLQAGHPAATRWDADPITALRALLRRPWLAYLPLERAGVGLRSALATISADERTHFRLLGAAQRLARFSRTTEAAGIIEAVALNPTATLAVQRRCRRLARLIRCHYLDGWRATHPTSDQPLWTAGPQQQRATLDRLEEHTTARHRTVWSAALLTANPQLTGDVRDRLTVHLDRHLTAVDTDPDILDLLADRLAVDPTVRERWHDTTRHGAHHRRRGTDEGDVTGRAGPPEDGAEGWPHLHLDDCSYPDTAHHVALQLTRRLGTAPDPWNLAWLLLRDGWDTPLADLPAVIAALQPDTEVAA